MIDFWCERSCPVKSNGLSHKITNQSSRKSLVVTKTRSSCLICAFWVRSLPTTCPRLVWATWIRLRKSETRYGRLKLDANSTNQLKLMTRKRPINVMSTIKTWLRKDWIQYRGKSSIMRGLRYSKKFCPIIQSFLALLIQAKLNLTKMIQASPMSVENSTSTMRTKIEPWTCLQWLTSMAESVAV